MELIAAVLIAGPLGYFVRTRTRSLAAYLVLWAVIFPIQTVVVHAENPDDIVRVVLRHQRADPLRWVSV